MRDLWHRIESYFAKCWPQKELKLRPPATPQAIAAAEQELGVRFPDDFRESLLVHDGQEDEPSILWLPAAGKLASLDSLVECWKDDRQSYDAELWANPSLDESNRVLQAQLHPKHIPFAGSTYWDYDRLLFDFAPGPAGREAQIIVRFDIEHRFLVDTWRGLMETAADGLEDGSIVPGECGPELSHWVTMGYRSPRAGKSIDWFEYYGR
jgi:cell wall assembly regulator SMI1